MSLPQMKTRFGDSDGFIGLPFVPMCSRWRGTVAMKRILVTGVQAIDGSGLYHILVRYSTDHAISWTSSGRKYWTKSSVRT